MLGDASPQDPVAAAAATAAAATTTAAAMGVSRPAPDDKAATDFQ